LAGIEGGELKIENDFFTQNQQKTSIQKIEVFATPLSFGGVLGEYFLILNF